MVSSNGSNEVTEHLKRFNDIFTLLFVVITILFTVDLAFFDLADFSLTVLFKVGSLVVWAFGHLLGANVALRHIEIQLKLIGWLYASLVACDVVVKFALRLPTLSSWWASLCIVVSVCQGLRSSSICDGVFGVGIGMRRRCWFLCLRRLWCCMRFMLKW